MALESKNLAFKELLSELNKKSSTKFNLIEDVKVVGKSNIAHKIDILLSHNDKRIYFNVVDEKNLEKDALRSTITALDIGSKIYLIINKDEKQIGELNNKVNSKLIEFISEESAKNRILSNNL